MNNYRQQNTEDKRENNKQIEKLEKNEYILEIVTIFEQKHSNTEIVERISGRLHYIQN